MIKTLQIQKLSPPQSKQTKDGRTFKTISFLSDGIFYEAPETTGKYWKQGDIVTVNVKESSKYVGSGQKGPYTKYNVSGLNAEVVYNMLSAEIEALKSQISSLSGTAFTPKQNSQEDSFPF